MMSIAPKPTVSSQLRTQLSNKKIDERQNAENNVRLQRAQRLKAAVEWQSRLNAIRLSSPESIQQKLAALRIEGKTREREYQRELREMAKRVEDRPLLMDLETRQNAIRWAERRYNERLRSNGLSEPDLLQAVARSKSCSSFASVATSESRGKVVSEEGCPSTEVDEEEFEEDVGTISDSVSEKS